MEKLKEKGLRVQDDAGVIALEDGIALREWLEIVTLTGPQRLACRVR